MKDEVEVRFAWYGGLMVTSQQIKMIRFDLEMKEHYRKEREDHELLMHAMKLQTALIRWYSPFSWFFVL